MPEQTLTTSRAAKVDQFVLLYGLEVFISNLGDPIGDVELLSLTSFTWTLASQQVE